MVIIHKYCITNANHNCLVYFVGYFVSFKILEKSLFFSRRYGLFFMKVNFFQGMFRDGEKGKWINCLVGRMRVRQLCDDEKEEIKAMYEASCKRVYHNCASRERERVMGLLKEAACGLSPPREPPTWVKMLWETIDDDETRSVHDMDQIIINCDLARLGYLLELLKTKFLQKLFLTSWTRVTLAMEANARGLKDGCAVTLVFPEESLAIVARHCSPDGQVLDIPQVKRILHARIESMNHATEVMWLAQEYA